jgi:hypothetical protein
MSYLSNSASASLALMAIAITGSSIAASQNKAVPIQERAKGAQHVVVAGVERVEPRFERNEFGDDLIVSHVTLRVTESLKGNSPQQVAVSVEGGTIGDLTLHVSDLPSLKAGERGVFFLEQDRAGKLKPHLRGLGILKLDADDRVRGENLRLSDIRAAARSGR